MPINKDSLEKFLKNLPKIETGKTAHYNFRRNVIYLERGCKEKSFWHEMGHAFLCQYKGYKVLYFLGANTLFIIFTVFLTSVTIILIGSRTWKTTYILLPVFCALIIAIDEMIASYYGRVLKRQAGPEILSKMPFQEFGEDCVEFFGFLDHG